MRVGFFVTYSHNASAYAAVLLGRDLHARGYVVSFYNSAAKASQLDPMWDAKVCTRDSRFYDWALRHDVLISFPSIDAAVVRDLDERGVRIIAVWAPEIVSEAGYLRSCCLIVTPSQHAYRVLLHAGTVSKRVACIPWDCGLEPQASRGDGVLVAVPGDEARRSSNADLLEAAGLLQQWGVPTTIWYRPSSLTSGCRGVFKNLRRRCSDDGVVAFDNSPWHAAEQLFLAHKVTLVPARHDLFGLTASRAARCGSVAVTYNAPPWAEMLNVLTIDSPWNLVGRGIAYASPAHVGVSALVDVARRCCETDMRPSPDVERLHKFRSAWDEALQRP